MQAVFDRHRVRLRQVFSQYAAMEGFGHSQDIKEFIAMLADLGVLSDGFSRRNVLTIFNNSQAQQSAEDLVTSNELNFTEFLEAIAACAAFKFPNPFTGFAQHLEHFLSQYFAKKESGPSTKVKRRRGSVEAPSESSSARRPTGPKLGSPQEKKEKGVGRHRLSTSSLAVVSLTSSMHRVSAAQDNKDGPNNKDKDCVDGGGTA